MGYRRCSGKSKVRMLIKKFEKYIDTVSATAYYLVNDTVSEYKANRRTGT